MVRQNLYVNQIFEFMHAGAPSRPSNITATNITNDSIGLKWTPPASLSNAEYTAPITGYIVNVSYANGTIFPCPTSQCNLTTGNISKTTISGLDNDTQYHISVSAINCIGEGSPSPVLQVTTGSQSLMCIYCISK